MLILKGQAVQKEVSAEMGLTLLDHALKHKIDWAFSCARGTCARCRCLITEGGDLLASPTDAEWDRLEPEELEQGFRLGCQAAVMGEGRVSAVWKPYF